ncbi:ABC transporter substrate-binding protein [Rhodopseudomonas palustris]|uniref:ABC transporter substrate-binding protein n=1 Tax=Rhodopseudomonas palustris TaxID=1076 RepID=UPI000E5AFB7F|nr:ABC transporter substrate-binding protein [Rhodopseudomonas palustris]QLH70501.1 ABC transporter substrate-binding protein [Rhodopseudomonas palustris]RIA03852.1 ABC transporter substrate-binding protein [Rhodopseudomonas palustris]
MPDQRFSQGATEWTRKLANIRLRKCTVALAMVAAVLLAAPVRAAEVPQPGGTLTAIIQPEPVILTAALNTAAPTGTVSGNIFDGLVDYDTSLKPIPALAESWETSADGLSFTLHLRKGVLWHDGKPFTSADVKWTLENVWKTIHPRNQATFAKVRAVETPDDATVILRLSEPSVAILSSINSNGAQVLPKHLYEGTDILNNPYNNKPVGTGPFVFKEWKKGEYILLEKNPNYWDKGKPYLDKVIYKVVPDAAARSAGLEKGEIQYATLSPVPLKDAERLGKLPGLKIETAGYEWLSPWLFLDFNVERGPLKDIRVRHALARAIDRKAVANVVWYGFAKPAGSPIPSTLAAFHDASAATDTFDVKSSDALLDEAGFKRGADGNRFTLFIDYIPYGDDYKRTAEYIKQALKRVGVDVTIRTQDTAAYTKRVYGDRDFDLSITWFAAFSDPQIGVTRAYWSASVGKNIPWTNGSGYRSNEVDQIISKVQGEPDPVKRVALFKDFQKIVLTDLPTLPLVELKFFTVQAANLKTLKIRGDQVYGSFRDFWFEVPKQN